MENEKDITKEEFKETAGMQFARAVKPAGCILLLLILLGVLYLCFTSGTDPIPGYEAPQGTEYYSDHLNELQSELQEHVFPKLDGYKESRVKNGQRVSVILLEDIMVGGIPVPKNTHLMARCKLSDRLELEFENIEIGGRILHLGYEAYDVDGSRGIYCPDVSNTGKQVRSRGSNIISSTLSGRLGRIANEVLSTGVSIAQSAGGEITVSVPAGYTFYIVKSKK